MLKTRFLVQTTIILILFALMPFSGYAQEETTLPEVTETPVAEPVTETPPPQETLIPIETPSPEVTEAPTEVFTEIPAEIATEVATIIPVPSETAPEGIIATEPSLRLLVRELFDNGDLSPWTVTAGWSLVPSENGLALQVVNSGESFSFHKFTFFNSAAQIRVSPQSGSAQLSLRQSVAGNYTASIDPTGRVTLYRAGILWHTTLVSSLNTGEWATLRLSAMDDVVRVSVNEVEVIAVVDSAMLPPGTIGLSGGFGELPQNKILMDDFFVWVPEAEVSAYPQPTPMAAIQPTPGLAGADKDHSAYPEPSAELLASSRSTLGNNDFSGILIGGVPYGVTDNTVGDTIEGGEPTSTCGFGMDNTVWFSYQPANTGTYLMTLAGSDFDTILAVYTGASVNALSQMACNDDVSATILTSQLTVNLAAGTMYRIQIGGFNGRYGNYSLSVQQTGIAIPHVPTLANPSTGFITDDTTPDVSWNAVGGASQYEVQWATNSAYTANLQSALVVGTTHTLPTLPDSPGTVYYWRVRALNINSQGSAFSLSRTFTLDTQDPNPPTQTAPAQNAVSTNAKPKLTWGSVSGASTYLVDIDDDDDFSSLLVDNAVVTTPSYTPTSSLSQGTYYWRVQSRDAALNESGESVSVPARAFTVNILNTPVNNGVIIANGMSNQAAPMLKWTAVVGASAYTVQIDDDTDFSADLVRDVLLGNVTTYTVSPALDTGVYYWRVVPTGFPPADSIYFSFTISPTLLAAPSLVSPATLTVTDDTTPDVSWNAVGGASQYEVQWATNSAYTVNLQSALVVGTTHTLPTLPDSPGTVYYWRVRTLNSLNAAGAFSLSRTFTLDTQDPNPPTQTAPAQNAVSTNAKPKLTWGSVSGASTYLVDIDDDDDFSSLLVDNAVVTTPSYTPTSSLSQGTYYWRVQSRDAALNESGESVSVPARAFTVNILNTPVNNGVIIANGMSNQAAPMLKWTAVVGASAYTVQIDDDTDFSADLVRDVLLGNVTTYTVSPALDTGVYYWRVVPTGFPPADSIYFSFTISPTLLAAPSLVSPATLTVTDDTTPDVSWNAVGGASQYEVQWATNSAYTVNLQSALVVGTTHTLPTLPDSPGTVYYWRVRTLNSLNAAGAFSLSRTFTLDTQDPNPPTQTAPAQNAVSTNAKPKLTWGSVSGASTYLVDIDDDDDFSSLLVDNAVVTTPSYTPTSSLSQGTYYWRVQSRDAALNESGESVSVPARAFTVNILNTPVNNGVIIANGMSNQAAPMLKWTAVVGASAYTVQIDDDTDFSADLVRDVLLGNVTTYTVSPALDTGVYYWRVVPTGFPPADSIYFSFTISPTLLAAPSLVSPATLTVTDDTTPDVSWNAVGGASQYEVQWATNSAYTVNLQSALVVGTTHTLPTLPDSPGTVYYWRVRTLNSLNAAGAFSLSRTFTLDTQDPNPPTQTAPANNIATTTNPPTFTWVAPGGASKYEIRYGTTNPPTIIVSNLTTTSFKPSSPLLPRNYFWQVKAIDAAGNESPWSSLRSVKIISVNNAAPVLNRFTTTTVPLSWGPVSWTAGGGYYQVQVDNNNTFASPEFVNNNIPSGTQTVTTSALPSGTWYWRVRACTVTNACGAWSNTGTFTTE